MTNKDVGPVYQKVIQEVIDNSQMDFQDSGVDPSTLELLRSVWQQRLSQLQVASFPWDPEPTPPPQIKTEDMSDVPGELAADGKRIKPERESESLPPPPAPLGQALSDPSLAAARAQQMVEKKFGNQQRNNGAIPMIAGGGLMLPAKPQPPSQSLSGQTDGPSDDLSFLSRPSADEQIGQIILEGNEMRAQEEAISEAMRRFAIQTDVLQERNLNKRKKRKSGNTTQDSTTTSSSSMINSEASVVPKLSQTDGPELDEDAINSDLDDSDEEPVDDDDEAEGSVPQIMLCMYDKVQRTKNKWKCVLKDGILTVNGKEYVFRKANGEYEW